MLSLHLHPDNLVIIRDDAQVLYIDTLANFELDFGAAIEQVPGWSEHLYVPGVMNRLGNGFTQETTMDAWTQGDQVLAAINSIIEAKELRLELNTLEES